MPGTSAPTRLRMTTISIAAERALVTSTSTLNACALLGAGVFLWDGPGSAKGAAARNGRGTARAIDSAHMSDSQEKGDLWNPTVTHAGTRGPPTALASTPPWCNTAAAVRGLPRHRSMHAPPQVASAATFREGFAMTFPLVGVWITSAKRTAFPFGIRGALVSARATASRRAACSRPDWRRYNWRWQREIWISLTVSGRDGVCGGLFGPRVVVRRHQCR
jgi:hypothetical protein